MSLKALSYSKIILYSQNVGNSSIDLYNSNYFERLMLVLFRPFFFDVKTFFQLFVSIENLFTWVVVIVIFFKNLKISVNKKKGYAISINDSCFFNFILQQLYV